MKIKTYEGKAVTGIRANAFQNCSSLTSVTIPDSVITIEKFAFSGCSGLKSISLPFVGGDTKTANDTYQYPFGYIFATSSYTGGTATQQNYDIFSATYYVPTFLKTVIITGSTYIPNGAFYNCTSLTSVTIGNSVTDIGRYAFYCRSGLTDITFNGTIAEWNAISKGSDWDTNAGAYTIHCTDGDISK